MVIELDSQYEKRKQEIEKIVKNVIEKHNIEISQTAFDNLIIHLSLCISRELNGTYITTSESQINHLKEHEYYPAAVQIIEILEKEFDLCDDEMEEVINETIVKIKEILNLDLRKNKEFYTGMTLHFYPALDRLQNNQQLTNNPLKDQIQSQHETEFECAKIFNSIVEEHYKKSFNEHELAYIALHFGTAFRQQ